MDILLIGCGVSGLSTGIRLLESGYSVTIWAKALPGSAAEADSSPAVTSEVAAAVWYPYKAYPQDKVNAWGATAYAVFREIASADSPLENGVVMSEILDLLPNPSPDPWWVETVHESFRHARPAELPAGYQDGYVFAAPVIDMSIYLPYLQRWFTTAGGQITERSVTSLDEPFSHCPIVVNCAGLGARELVGDALLYAALGQVIRIRPREGIQRAVMDDYGPNRVAYIVPRLRDIVLGGIDEDRNEDVRPNTEATASILRRCANLIPELASLPEEDILAVVCGLRPARPSVRLEREEVRPGNWVVHNYGHGGAGVTLSWGCAAEVVDLVKASDTNHAS
jgi:D-amino-acid oxidase